VRERSECCPALLGGREGRVALRPLVDPIKK
jgi:hypothetical protein